MSEQKPKRDPSALTSEYHKARKQLMLWAGILLIWELVGVDLEKAKEAEGNVGALVKSIKSPQAVPWVLLILVGYFLFKVTVEWYQCNETRRNMRVAKIDFHSAWVVSLLAYILYLVQAISHVQFADVLQTSNKWQSLIIGVGCGLPIILAVKLFEEREKSEAFGLTLLFILLQLSPAIIVIVIVNYLWIISWRFLLIGIVLTNATVGSIFLIIRLRKRKILTSP
jgi:hypothetical protein